MDHPELLGIVQGRPLDNGSSQSGA
jgi:hypothetical protein